MTWWNNQWLCLGVPGGHENDALTVASSNYSAHGDDCLQLCGTPSSKMGDVMGELGHVWNHMKLRIEVLPGSVDCWGSLATV